MDAELKERARAWLEDVGLYGYIDSEGHVEALTTLLAGVRAETEARVVEAARACCDLDRGCDCEVLIADRIHALAPGDYVAVRRDGFDVIAEAAEELEARIRMERTGYDSPRADEIRTALSRARKENQ